ncbi:MAG: hypothetical protein ACXVIG_02685 [Halobacteriota archaeon]
MKKPFLAGTLAVVMLVAVLAAGCTSPTTSSPTPTPSTSTTTATTTTAATEEQAVIQYLTMTMQQRNFTVVTPFALQPSPSGIAVYNATVSDQNGTYAVSVWSFNTSSGAQAQFLSLRNMYVRQGYAAIQQNATVWSGFNASARHGAAVEYGTSPLMPSYVMIITGGATEQGTFQQSMWIHMLDVMHTYGGNGYGMGPHMGSGLNSDTLNDMQQEMYEHMGGGPFGPSMMSSS